MMMPWLKQPIAQMTTWAIRMRFYVVAIILVAISVPFLHLYMDDQLSLAEMIVHTLIVVLSTTISIAFFEFILWVYLKGIWSISIGLFWLFLFGVFVLSFILMGVTHDFLPITLDIWNKHIMRDFRNYAVENSANSIANRLYTHSINPPISIFSRVG